VDGSDLRADQGAFDAAAGVSAMQQVIGLPFPFPTVASFFDGDDRLVRDRIDEFMANGIGGGFPLIAQNREHGWRMAGGLIRVVRNPPAIALKTVAAVRGERIWQTKCQTALGSTAKKTFKKLAERAGIRPVLDLSCPSLGDHEETLLFVSLPEEFPDGCECETAVGPVRT
jgi:hypothetical protein